MDNGRAPALGFGFGRVADRLPGVIAETAGAAATAGPARAGV
ncbi:hypothetical protein [Streptomyces sp. NPDC059566]